MAIRVISNYFLIGVLSVMSTATQSKKVFDDFEGLDITVHVKNIDRTRPGNILIMLYEYEGFPKDHAKALQITVMPAVVDQMSINFSSVPKEFAIKVLHDEDNSGQVTKNWTGIIPAEGLGFSNGAKLSFRAPRFDEAKLNLSHVFSPLTIDIIYP